MADVNEMRQKFFTGRKQDIDSAAAAQGAEAQDALSRRFASIGQGSGSGAAIGAALKSQGDIAKQKDASLRSLSGEELQSQMQEAEAQKGRDFQSGLAGRQEALQREQMAQQKDQFGRQLSQQGEQFGKTFGQHGEEFGKQYELEKQAQEFNMGMANEEQRRAGRPGKGMFDFRNEGGGFDYGRAGAAGLTLGGSEIWRGVSGGK